MDNGGGMNCIVFVRHYYHDRYPLMAPMEEEDGGGRSWPAIVSRMGKNEYKCI
jgi:hypothetical protein